MFHIRFSGILLLIVYVNAAKLPSFIKPCSKDDPQLNDCVVKAANNALQHILEGYKPLRFPPLNPLKIDKLELTGTTNLQIKLNNVNVHGLEKFKLVKANLDLPNKKFQVDGEIDALELDSDYEINGNILILPIRGKGPSKFKFNNCKFQCSMEFTFHEKNGHTFANITEHHVKYEAGGIHYELNNLFNGDEKLGTEMNKFLNENWAEVGKEISPAVESTLDSVIYSLMKNLLDRVPYEEVFV